MNIEAIEEQIPRSRSRYDRIINYYRSLALEEAVINAANAIEINDVMSAHQRRVGRIKCAEGAAILKQPNRLERIADAKNFEDIFVVTEEVRNMIDRLGPLWSYDTAQKIGFHLSKKINDPFFPNSVYLQSGARTGAYRLADNPEESISRSDLRGRRIVDSSIFPEILAQQPPYIIENILCVGQHRENENWLRASN